MKLNASLSSFISQIHQDSDSTVNFTQHRETLGVLNAFDLLIKMIIGGFVILTLVTDFGNH